MDNCDTQISLVYGKIRMTMTMTNILITQERLHRCLTYDRTTGIFKWISGRADLRTTEAGSIDSNGYIQIRIDGIKYSAAKLAILYVLDTWPDYVDHIDTNITNNTFTNLRVCSCSENAFNKNLAINNTTGLKGITRDIHGYRVRICAFKKTHSKRFSFSNYSTEELTLDAAVQYAENLRIQLHGEYTNHGHY